MDNTPDPPVNNITIDPESSSRENPTSDGGDGGTHRIVLDVDPEKLNKAANKANKDEKDDDGMPNIRAVPALVSTTGVGTTASALAWGPALGAAGLAAVAATTAAGTTAFMVATRTGKQKQGSAAKKTQRTTKGGSRNGLRRSGGGNVIGPRRPGTGATGKGGGKNTPAGKRSTGGSTGGKKNTNPTPSPATGGKAKRGAELLANGHGRPDKHRNGRKNDGTDGGKNGTKNGKNSPSNGRQTGKSRTRAALNKAANSMTGRAAQAAAKGLHNATTRPLGKAAKKIGQSKLGQGVKKIAKTPLRAAQAAARGLHRVTTRPLGRAAKKAWNSRATNTVRAAASRLGRAARAKLARPREAARNAFKSLWSRIRPGRGLYAHLARTTAIGAWALVCSLASLALAFGWLKSNKGGLWAWRILKTVWRRLYARSRKRLKHIRTAHGMTGHVASGTTEPLTGTRGNHQPESEAEAHARRMAEDYAALGPRPDMAYVGAEYKGLGDGIRSAARGVEAVTRIANGAFPMPPHITRAIRALVGDLHTSAQKGDDLYQHFRNVHEHDIKRLENSRVNIAAESGWNIVPGVHTDGGGITDRPSHFAAAIQNVADACEAWETPTHPVQVMKEFNGMGGAVEQVANTVQRLRDQAHDIHPVTDGVTDQLGNLAQNLFSCASEAHRIAFLVKTWCTELTYELESS